MTSARHERGALIREARRLRERVRELHETTPVGRAITELETKAAELEQAAVPPSASEVATRLAVVMDQLPGGAAILFDKGFTGVSPKTYTYAAVKDPNGTWNTSGPSSPKAYTSLQFARWILGLTISGGRRVEQVHLAAGAVELLNGDQVHTDAPRALNELIRRSR